MFEVSQQELVGELAEGLKKKIEKPDWASFVKTGMHKERPPVDEDWWYMRAGSILRQVELKGPIGVSKLRYKYGGRKNNGMAPEHFYKGSGKVIRTILQQLEKANLVKQDQKGSHKGHVLTSEGKSFLFQTAGKMEKAGEASAKPKPKKTENKKEKKSDKENKKEEKKSGKDENDSSSKGSDKKKEKKSDKDSKKSDKKEAKKDDSGDKDGKK